MCDRCDIPIGWEDVTLTEAEADDLQLAADYGEIAEASRIVDGAYDRMFGMVN